MSTVVVADKMIDLICRGMKYEDASFVAHLLNQEEQDPGYRRTQEEHKRMIAAFRTIPRLADAAVSACPYLKIVHNSEPLPIRQTHTIFASGICPITREPKEGEIRITYQPSRYHLDIPHLKHYISQFRGGWKRIEEPEIIQGIEMVIQVIKRDCCLALEVEVEVMGLFTLHDGTLLTVTA
jgi:hypothetical protein